MGRKKRASKLAFILTCVSPALLLFVIFMIIPTINVFTMSMYKWGGFTKNKTFVGLKNFESLLTNEKFFRSMQNSIFLIVIVTIITFGLSILFASILSREKIKGKSFFRVIFYIPNILSVVVIGAIFSAIYDPTSGLMNSFLALFNKKMIEDPILWLGKRNIVMYSVAIAMIWQAVGYYMVMYMASMANVSESLYESASIEGAGRVTQFFKITIPLIWTNIRTTLTFFIISNINMSFLLVRVMTNGNPDGASDVFLSYMYKEAYDNSSYGYGMAIGVIIFLFSFALAAIVNASTKREDIQF